MSTREERLETLKQSKIEQECTVSFFKTENGWIGWSVRDGIVFWVHGPKTDDFCSALQVGIEVDRA